MTLQGNAKSQTWLQKYKSIKGRIKKKSCCPALSGYNDTIQNLYILG